MQNTKNTKAVALLSGGLDSIIAALTIKNSGIRVYGITFSSPFFGNKNLIKKISRRFKIPVKFVDVGNDYIKLIKKPKYGYGKNLNPCIDCKIYMLKKARAYAKKINADFIITGEVQGQRPKSQNEKALRIIKKDSKLSNKLLRPMTELLKIEGRTRTEQFKLAKKFGIKDYASPSGGCLLTDKEYCKKLKDLIKYNKNIKINDLNILKYGRHFRYSNNKIIVGRNQEDNKNLMKVKGNDYYIEAKKCSSPITIIQGRLNKDILNVAAAITARYSNSKNDFVLIKYGKNKLTKSLYTNKLSDNLINELRIK